MDFKVTFTRDKGQPTEKSVCNLDEKEDQNVDLVVEHPQFQTKQGLPPRVRFQLPINDVTEDLVEEDDIEIALRSEKVSFDEGGVFMGVIESKVAEGGKYVVTCLGNMQRGLIKDEFQNVGVIDD